MYLDNTEITLAEESTHREIAQVTITQLSELDLCLIAGGMGDVQQ